MPKLLEKLAAARTHVRKMCNARPHYSQSRPIEACDGCPLEPETAPCILLLLERSVAKLRGKRKWA